MANDSPLLKTSSNLEIPQNNRKNFPTENEIESNTTLDCPDEKPSESQLRKNTVTDTTTGEMNYLFVFYFILFRALAQDNVSLFLMFY